MSTPKTHPKAKKKSNKAQSQFSSKKYLIAFITLVIIVACVLWSSLFKSYPVEGNKQMLSIGHGDTYSGFIDRLAKEDKASFPLVLKLYQKFFIHDTMKAGVYEIPKGTSIRQVLEMVSNSDNAQLNRILVIEGTTFKDLINNLKKDDLVTHEVSHLSDEELLKALDIPLNHPEGLFAPDTYFYAKGESDKKILKDLYSRQMKALDEAWENRAPDLPYKDKYEALIMASIIEKETNVDAELEQVSGVFARRLNIGMRLQTDPTVIYGMGERYQGNISRQDLRTPTAYNTYTINGLPPTPISLPSAKAIEATLHPDQSDTLYFVATGNGGHQFSRTYEEHKQAIESYHKTIGVK